jgi:hypothetical protein
MVGKLTRRETREFEEGYIYLKKVWLRQLFEWTNQIAIRHDMWNIVRRIVSWLITNVNEGMNKEFDITNV